MPLMNVLEMRPLRIGSRDFLENLIINYLHKQISYETFEKKFRDYMDLRNMLKDNEKGGKNEKI